MKYLPNLAKRYNGTVTRLFFDEGGNPNPNPNPNPNSNPNDFSSTREVTSRAATT